MPQVGVTFATSAPDYTHKFNLKTGRHGWLRLTPAYSVKVVQETISRYGEGLNILDPFCGTGTTALCAVAEGHRATTVDINPFLTWLARAKTSAYAAKSLAETERAGISALDLTRRKAIEPAPVPSIHRIERWWPRDGILLSRLLKGRHHRIDHQHAGARSAASRVLPHSHQALQRPPSITSPCRSKTTTCKDSCRLAWTPVPCSWTTFDSSLQGASDNPLGRATVVQGDARDLRLANAGFDLVVTSPPYANRMSYIRELRPYMYWLGHLANARDAGELDWQAIGGTWGIATSRLNAWTRRHERWLPDELQSIVAAIAADANANGSLLAAYVAKYCEDMSRHFDGLRTVLKRNARVHYIVGNSTFYGVLVPTEQLYAAMLREYGFEDVAARPIRKRNSNKALFEFDVSAVWPDG